MQLKQSCVSEQKQTNNSQKALITQAPAQKRRRKMIPRHKKQIKSNKKVLKQKKIKKQNKENGTNIANVQPKIVAVVQVNQDCPVQNNTQIKEQPQDPKKHTIQKIIFDPTALPQKLQQLYKNKQKMKNTDLMVPGCKFVVKLGKKAVQKWNKAIIVYQEAYKNQQRNHFGVILKCDQRLITFDGVTKLWPIKQVQKSYHWVPQTDTWSCGYRALFWINKVIEQGIDKWVSEFQLPPPDTETEVKQAQ